MIPKFLLALWSAAAPALGNHLWQSTLFLVVAGLLALVLRKNHARARYGLWLAASVKFLLPFSLLVMLGNQFATPRRATIAATGFDVVIEEASQPFTHHATPASASAAPVVHAAAAPSIRHFLPGILVALWLCGFVVVLAAGCARWRRVSAAVRRAVPLRTGREVEALRRVERMQGIRRPIEVRVAKAALEPGIFGIVRPVLMWPEGISPHLDDAHLEAIMAHELTHVRRHDNLAAVIHMLVEAVFWFHPLVWWLSARLVEERERACDEAVLASGSERQVYAESILKTCEFCVQSPLACVSGITGADLKKRILGIMTERLAQNLSVQRKVLLGSVALAAVAIPIFFGLTNAPRVHAQTPIAGAPGPSFEVATVKPDHSEFFKMGFDLDPGRFEANGVTVKSLMAFAYNVRDFQITGGPNWINTERFNIEAKEPDAVSAELEKLPREQRRDKIGQMVQALLADRFRLKASHDARELPVYDLVVAKNGPKLQETKVGETHPNNPNAAKSSGQPLIMMRMGRVVGQAVPIEFLAQTLSQQLGKTVVNKTGLKGDYDFTLAWTPDQSERAMMAMGAGPGPGPGVAPGRAVAMGSAAGPGALPGQDAPAPPEPDGLSIEPDGPSIFTAVLEQLGLKLEPAKGPVDLIVIDQIEKPSEN